MSFIFVYNADTGLSNLLADVAHKVFSPSTYPCKLCGLTYGPLGMKRKWRSFVENLGRPVQFLHRDEFRTQTGLSEIPLPAIFVRQQDGEVVVWVSADEINSMRTLDALMDAIRPRPEVALHGNEPDV